MLGIRPGRSPDALALLMGSVLVLLLLHCRIREERARGEAIREVESALELLSRESLAAWRMTAGEQG